MARLDRLPERTVVDGFRGTVDFYVYRGLNVARMWPRNKAAGYSPGALRFQPVFARVNRLKPLTGPSIKVACDRYRMGGSATWADDFLRAYFGKNRPNDQPLPPPPPS